MGFDQVHLPTLAWGVAIVVLGLLAYSLIRKVF